MRRLLYVPIIHTSADLGSLAKALTKRDIADLGEDFWKEHKKTVDAFWDVILEYFDFQDVSGMKIYQDGMAAEGEMGAKIVEEGLKSGSRNFQLVSKLLSRGAILIKTEDFSLVKKERDKLLEIIQAGSFLEKLFVFIKYRLTKGGLLNKRDEFIAGRIDETLHYGETGILFIGAYHNVKKKLSKSILIREVKDIEKVREYHRLLPFYKKNKGRFSELTKYLVSEVEI